MDAFITAVEEARRQLTRQEGRDVSVRELIRRAGFPESRRAGVAYHLNPRINRERGHKVPADIVQALAAVLPVSEAELSRAAQVAAGFNVADETHPDIDVVVARYYGDQSVSDEEKQQVTARLLQILAEESQRPRRSVDDNPE